MSQCAKLKTITNTNNKLTKNITVIARNKLVYVLALAALDSKVKQYVS